MSVAKEPTFGVVSRLAGGLIVSCQAPAGHPFRDPTVIARLAVAAALGGAVAVRVNAAEDVRAVKAATELPVIGIHKVAQRRGRDLITPRFELAAQLAAAGADIIGLEATTGTPADGADPTRLLARVRDELGLPVMADVATQQEGTEAWAAGADLVATTLSGYTSASTPGGDGPDLELVASLHGCGVRTVAEGRYRGPDDVSSAFACGAFAVVVGTAITDPVAITRVFVRATPAMSSDLSSSTERFDS